MSSKSEVKMKRFIYGLILSLTMFSSASAAILLVSPNGSSTSKTTLSAALNSVDAAGKKVIVTSPLTAVMSNISSATVHRWPTTIQLELAKGGSIANTTTFKSDVVFTGGTFSGTGSVILTDKTSIQGIYQTFTGTGLVNYDYPATVYPEQWGAVRASTTGAYNAADYTAADSGIAARKAVAAITGYGGVIELTGAYTIQTAETNAGIEWPTGVTFQGINALTTGFFIGDSFPLKPFLYTAPGALHTVHAHNFFIVANNNGDAYAADAIVANDVTHSTFRNLSIRSFRLGTGLKFTESGVGGYFNIVENPYIACKGGMLFFGDGNVGVPNAVTVTGGEVYGSSTYGEFGIQIKGHTSSININNTDVEGTFSNALVVLDDARLNTLNVRLEPATGTKIVNIVNDSYGNFFSWQAEHNLKQSEMVSGSAWPDVVKRQVTINLTGAQGSYTISPMLQASDVIINVTALTADLNIYLPAGLDSTNGYKVTVVRALLETSDTAYMVNVIGDVYTKIDESLILSVPARSSVELMLIVRNASYAAWKTTVRKLFATAKPTSGVYALGTQVNNDFLTTTTDPGWAEVFYLASTLASSYVIGNTAITVASGTGTANGDNVAIIHTDGTVGWYTIQSGGGTTSITLSSGLTKDAASGQVIIFSRWKTLANMTT